MAGQNTKEAISAGGAAVVQQGPFPVTIGDCAELANGVYLNKDMCGSWRRLRGLVLTTGSTGFEESGYVSAPYVRGTDLVLAFRGTHNGQSASDDGFMAPLATRGLASLVAKEFIPIYTRQSPNADASETLAELLWRALQANKAWQRGIWGSSEVNKLPEGYLPSAINAMRTVAQVAFEQGFHLRCVVGHSLGGALAQAASEHSGVGRIPRIPAISFNGPCMGNINGTSKDRGGGVMTINSRYDPLSSITALAGNESHAPEKRRFVVETNVRAVVPPPGVQSTKRADGYAVVNAARGVRDSLAFSSEFAGWLTYSLGPALGEGHSMMNLLAAIKSGKGVKAHAPIANYF
jgi:hypothetical protein